MTSTLTKAEPTLDFQERSLVAIRSLYQALGMTALKPAEQKYLSTALVEIATDEIAHNSEFGKALIARLNELLPKKAEKAKPTRKPAQQRNIDTVVLPQPIKYVPMSAFNPYQPPDPLLLQEGYGDENLPIVLETFTLRVLKQMASVVQEKIPGTKPRTVAKKEALVEFIISQLPQLATIK